MMYTEPVLTQGPNVMLGCSPIRLSFRKIKEQALCDVGCKPEACKEAAAREIIFT